MKDRQARFAADVDLPCRDGNRTWPGQAGHVFCRTNLCQQTVDLALKYRHGIVNGCRHVDELAVITDGHISGTGQTIHVVQAIDQDLNRIRRRLRSIEHDEGIVVGADGVNPTVRCRHDLVYAGQRHRECITVLNHLGDGQRPIRIT